MAQEGQQFPQPRNIFELINLNVYNVSQDLHRLMDEVFASRRETEEMRKEIAELRAMFNAPAPEQPNAVPGSDSAVTE